MVKEEYYKNFKGSEETHDILRNTVRKDINGDVIFAQVAKHKTPFYLSSNWEKAVPYSAPKGVKTKPTPTPTPTPSSSSAKEEPKQEAPKKNDDLTLVEGIGPKTVEQLNDNGVSTFAQLADLDAKSISALLVNGSSRVKNANTGTWSRQASLARDGKFDELKELQETLKVGV